MLYINQNKTHMNILVLFYNENQVLEVSDKLEDLYGLHITSSIVMVDDAFEINRYLFKHRCNIKNPDFLKSELNLFRADEKFEEKVFLGINEDDVMQLRQYLEDEIIN